MSNFFNQFTIVSKIVKYISWEDFNNFKRINKLCYEVSEREEISRCSSVLFGHVSLLKHSQKTNKRKKLSSDGNTLIKGNFQCKNPKLVLIMANVNEIPSLNEILNSHCDSKTTICYAHSKQGIIGCNNKEKQIQIKKTFSPKVGFSWLCLPSEIDVDVLMHDSEIKPTTKLVIVLNVSKSNEDYRVRIFEDFPNVQNPVYYAGGLVNSIKLFNINTKSFENLPHISIAISGDNFHVDKCVLKEEHEESEAIIKEFVSFKERNDEFIKSNKIKNQCMLIYSCYLRKEKEIYFENELQPMSEYDAVSKFFPNIPIIGVLCEGEIFHINEGVVKLVKRLYFHDIISVTSIFLLLSWTK